MTAAARLDAIATFVAAAHVQAERRAAWAAAHTRRADAARYRAKQAAERLDALRDRQLHCPASGHHAEGRGPVPRQAADTPTTVPLDRGEG